MIAVPRGRTLADLGSLSFHDIFLLDDVSLFDIVILLDDILLLNIVVLILHLIDLALLGSRSFAALALLGGAQGRLLLGRLRGLGRAISATIVSAGSGGRGIGRVLGSGSLVGSSGLRDLASLELKAVGVDDVIDRTRSSLLN